MDGFKIGSARIYQLFSNNGEQSSVRQDSTSSSAQKVVSNNTDAVKVSVSTQQDVAQVAQSQTRLEDLKQKVKSGEYQKQMNSKATAKSMVEFYSA